MIRATGSRLSRVTWLEYPPSMAYQNTLLAAAVVFGYSTFGFCLHSWGVRIMVGPRHLCVRFKRGE